jgi:hypothetical protein
LELGLLPLALLARCFSLSNNGDESGQEEIDNPIDEYQGQTHLRTKTREHKNRHDHGKGPSDQEAGSLWETVHDLHNKGAKQRGPKIHVWRDER